ncbi:MAG: hypothetical protein C4320_07940, partial [Armatimonadota bacterium]
RRIANANVRRNGRSYGSIGLPAASVVIDGERLAGAAIVVNNHVLVEMAPVFERLGVRTTYRAGDKKIEAFTQDRGISMTIGDRMAMLPDKAMLDVAPMIRDTKVFIPLRAIGRADVSWNKGTRTATIVSSSKTKPNGPRD